MCQNLWKYEKVCLKLRKWAKSWEIVLKEEQVWESVLKDQKVCQNLRKCAKSWISAPKPEKVWESVQNLRKLEKVWECVLNAIANCYLFAVQMLIIL